MSAYFGGSKTIGILGAGQLGKMLAQAASPWDLNLRMLDPAADAPAAHLCREFTQGDFRDRDAVLAFGKTCDLLTVEIEQVHVPALKELQAMGVKVYPDPAALEIIQDKGLQKDFFTRHGLPTAAYTQVDDPQTLRVQPPQLPKVQKKRTEGYDGRGVKILRTPEDLDDLLPGPSILEEAVDTAMEISVIAARNPSGDLVTYDPVEMRFHPDANLVEFLAAPAPIPPALAEEARALAAAAAEAFGIVGLLAVEMFIDSAGNLLINEVAPRPHNSGHHTIEACVTSQYEQHLRAILDLPLGDTTLRQPGVMLNLLGEAGHSGPVKYEGTGAVLRQSGAHLHLYGKTETRPYRKMGHLTVVHDDLDTAIDIARSLQPQLKALT